MILTPQEWAWDEVPGGALCLPESPADVPVVWRARLTDDPATEAPLFSLLSAEERARLARFRQREDQLRFLVGRGLLRLFMGTHLNIPAQRVEFGYGPFGKPFVVLSAGAPSMHFNVSHSGNLVLLAFSSTHEVGVDVEKVRHDLDCESMASQVFSSHELRAWMQLNAEQRLTEFYKAWTRHEAGLKAMGFGFGGHDQAPPDARLLMFDLSLPEGYQGSAACRKLEPASSA